MDEERENDTSACGRDGEYLRLSLEDCAALFPRLKENEGSLSKDERMVLLKLEKVLYGNLSISGIEELLGQRK